MYILNGQIIDETISQIIDNVQYPAGWFLDLNNRIALGLELFISVIPDYNPQTHEVIKEDPIKVEGIWTQQWSVVNLSTEESSAKLTAAKAKMWNAIRAKRDDHILNGGYFVIDHWYYSDLISRSQYLTNARKADIVQAANGDMDEAFTILGHTVAVKTMDDGYIPLTPTLAHAIVGAAEVQEFLTYVAALVHNSAMESTPNPEDYDFTSGWPAIWTGPEGI